MNLDKTILVILFIIPIVFLAGCARGPSAPTGAGVLITSFQPDLSEVEGSQQITFVVNLKNTGERTASNVKAVLFGLSDEWTWDKKFKPSDSGTSLAPADPSVGMKGEETSIDFTVTAAPAKSSDVTYDAGVRVFYGYTTVSDTTLRFVTSEYLKTEPSAQKGVLLSKTTSGPFLITVKAKTPLVKPEGTTARIQIEIQNTGGGKVGKVAATAGEVTDQDKITTITVKGVASCTGGTQAGDTATISNVRLTGGISKIISCDVSMRTVINFQDKGITVTLSYTYFVDSYTQVKVLKSLGEALVAPGTQPTPTPTTPVAQTTEEACKDKSENAACTVGGDMPFVGKCVKKSSTDPTLVCRAV